MRNRGRYRYKLHLLRAESWLLKLLGDAVRSEIDTMILDALMGKSHAMVDLHKWMFTKDKWKSDREANGARLESDAV